MTSGQLLEAAGGDGGLASPSCRPEMRAMQAHLSSRRLDPMTSALAEARIGRCLWTAVDHYRVGCTCSRCKSLRRGMQRYRHAAARMTLQERKHGSFFWSPMAPQIMMCLALGLAVLHFPSKSNLQVAKWIAGGQPCKAFMQKQRQKKESHMLQRLCGRDLRQMYFGKSAPYDFPN